MSTQEAGQLEQSYDEVPYESLCYAQTHPATTAMVARLFGLHTPDFRKARILELGCSGGGNLAPLALSYPSAECLGIDFSQVEIDEANALKAFAKLKNLEFRRQDILEFDVSGNKGAFDYIICHGVFSWVPLNVGAKILEICGACLKPDGIAVVSFNALPGWNAVRSVREMLMHNGERYKEPQEKIRQSRRFLDFLAENGAETGGYRAGIERERSLLKDLDDFYFFHDHLSGENHQFYFRDFMRMAGAQGLAYVGDAVLTTMFMGDLPPPAVKKLREFEDLLEQEQYMDYVTNRRFRTTILCRKGRKLNRQLSGEQLMDFHLSTTMQARGDSVDLKKPVTFISGAAQFTTDNPHASAMFLELISRKGKPVQAADLVAHVQARLGLKDPRPLRDTLINGGMGLVTRGFITLHADAPPCAEKLSAKPVASPIARYQAGKPGCKNVTSLLGSRVPTDPVANFILQGLDGSRGVADVARALAERIRRGDIVMKKNEQQVTDLAAIRAEVAKVTEQTAAKLLENCFFMASSG
ncbi:MAG: methyltransferase domain-containing protein [Alphaproteobacteria bacterium]|nr:MAG: methyltransferase domain-containing protein [Alphaproteobacteria bacterium]